MNTPIERNNIEQFRPTVKRRMAVDNRTAEQPAAYREFQPGAPLAPESVAEVGVRRAILEDLALKILYMNSSLSMAELSVHMRLRLTVIKDVLHRLRSEHLCEVVAMTGNVPQIAITGPGRVRAMELLLQNQYAGAAPVSLDSYVRQVRRQSVRDTEVHPPDVQRAFAHLVLDEKTLKKLGAALNSGTSIFLYGPSGTGKSSIATAIPQALSRDRVWVPYAVEIDGQIIVLYDPQLHASSEEVDVQSTVDARWALCRRPAVMVGGELTIDMLELQINPTTKFYTAPLQMKANNGVLIIDDFGRQRLRPDELLNRWVVPLDRRIDFLSLAGGRKVEVPFEMFVVFATNLDPAALVDAAFLRRIQTKIEVGEISEEHFHQIFRSLCSALRLRYDAAMIDELIALIRDEVREPLRACHPRDLVNQIRWVARYEQRPPVLDRESIRAATEAYFVTNSASPMKN
jgi:predicted ATPase with chaperone activity